MVTAEKDSNPYPWGENPNNGFKMYWNDAPNVLQDLDKFSALYIKSHGCVWSECSVGDDYDDDGEDRDGGAFVAGAALQYLLLLLWCGAAELAADC